MLRSAKTIAPLLFFMVAGCGPAQPAKDATDAEPDKTAEASETAEDNASEPAEASEAATGGESSDATSEAPAAGATGSESPAAELAYDLIKTGGRRIAYSPTKGFAFPIVRRAGDEYSLDIYFFDEAGQKQDIMQICQPGDCEERLKEIMKRMVPKLTSRLESGGYESIRSLGWPVGRNELEVNTLGMKLRYARGRLEALREKKPATALTQVGQRMNTPVVKAIFIIPGGKLLGVFGGQEGNEKGGQDFFIFKLPE